MRIPIRTPDQIFSDRVLFWRFCGRPQMQRNTKTIETRVIEYVFLSQCQGRFIIRSDRVISYSIGGAFSRSNDLAPTPPPFPSPPVSKLDRRHTKRLRKGVNSWREMGWEGLGEEPSHKKAWSSIINQYSLYPILKTTDTVDRSIKRK